MVRELEIELLSVTPLFKLEIFPSHSKVNLCLHNLLVDFSGKLSGLLKRHILYKRLPTRIYKTFLSYFEIVIV